jgi:hypothetical protein
MNISGDVTLVFPHNYGGGYIGAHSNCYEYAMNRAMCFKTRFGRITIALPNCQPEPPGVKPYVEILEEFTGLQTVSDREMFSVFDVGDRQRAQITAGIFGRRITAIYESSFIRYYLKLDIEEWLASDPYSPKMKCPCGAHDCSDSDYRGGRIYAIRSDQPDSPIKIGWTGGDTKARMRDLQIGNPHRLILLGTIDGSIRLERRLHCCFSKYRIGGEWFEPVSAIIDLFRNGPIR